MEVSESGRSFRFTWKVKYFSFLWHREHQFLKWTFNVKRNITTSWSLLLYPSTPKNCVSCVLRKESLEPLNFQIGYELCFLHHDGSSLYSVKVSNADFNSKNKSVRLWLHHDDVSLSEDALSICCKLWTADTPILGMVRYFAETAIKVERCTLTWGIVAFSGEKPGKKTCRFVINPLTGNICISFSLFLDQHNNFLLEMFVFFPDLVELCKCQVFLLDVSGRRLKCGQFEVVTIGKRTDPDWKFHLSLTKRNLMENKEQYLPNDTLTLQCEVAFAIGIEAEPVQKLEPDCQNILCNGEISNISKSPKETLESMVRDLTNPLQFSNSPDSVKTNLLYCFDPEEGNLPSSLKANTNSNSKNQKENNSKSTSSCMGALQSLDISPSAKEYYNSSLSWKDDLLILYENGTFCDAELLVASEYYPVHSLILSLRSPVFCEMLTCAKGEGERTSIKIEDLDAPTVRKMIIFLYTDILEDLECECAKGLYLASNKYEILPLKGISSSFLKQNLSTIHCCDILLLADRYKDDDLKQAVHNFIAKHDEVLNSDQWRSLEESHPRLIIETFRSMHLKLRKNEISSSVSNMDFFEMC